MSKEGGKDHPFLFRSQEPRETKVKIWWGKTLEQEEALGHLCALK